MILEIAGGIFLGVLGLIVLYILFLLGMRAWDTIQNSALLKWVIGIGVVIVYLVWIAHR